MISRVGRLIVLAGMLPTAALGCSAPDVQSFEERLEWTQGAFVGTVVGLRLDDTTLATTAPSCPDGTASADASDECRRFWWHVVSIQYEVETAIKGFEGARRYETTSIGNDDGCAPRVGERWLTSGWYRDGFSMRLEAALIDEWRTIATRDRD